ncbi:MAG: universal stress protein, partial [Flavobacteriaceae bacterium]|nr:universal stress protein [Flavobacteriaceae bacterium]
MKNILVPTDFSEQAENALHVAAQLAQRYDAEIFLLHLLELPLHQVDALSSHSELPEAMFFMKLAQKRFTDMMSRDYLQNVKVHETVEFNQSFNQLPQTCEEKNIDLIVMGSHGVSGLKEIFIGSNTEKV